MGLTSSGRGRTGDGGDCGMPSPGVLFHGVDEPGVSMDRRGREPRDSEKDAPGALGVCEVRGCSTGWPIGTGVCTGSSPGVPGTADGVIARPEGGGKGLFAVA